jgi:hypothetical protein
MLLTNLMESGKLGFGLESEGDASPQASNPGSEPCFPGREDDPLMLFACSRQPGKFPREK